jgi:GTPase
VTEAFRSGLVALAGRPNVGKSTLANALSGKHVAAVSPRPQTTRNRVSAVVHGDNWQAVLLDLPGFQRPADKLTTRMQNTVDHSLADCDAAIFVLNATESVGGGDRFIADRLRASGRPVIVALNQVDRLDLGGVARAIERVSPLVDFVALHPISALHGGGLEALRKDLASLLVAGPAFFPEGVATDQTDEELAGEIIREAALQRLRDEVPHSIAVSVENIARAGPKGRERAVEAAILVERDSQKGIVVGQGGAMIRSIGIAARQTLGRIWGVPVHLDLRVKVKKRWRQDDAMLDRLGL